MQQFKCFLLCSDVIVSWIRMLTGMNLSAGDSFPPMILNYLCLKVLWQRRSANLFANFISRTALLPCDLRRSYILKNIILN